VNNVPLAVQFPRLYELSFQKGFTVKRLKQQGWDMIQFRRTLLGDALQQRDTLKEMVDGIQLTEGKDRVKWKIGTFGPFRVKDLYLQMRGEESFPQKFLWKTKIPMKVRIFLWLMIKCSVLTKDNLLRRGWTGDPYCHFCSKNEIIDHLLFFCALAKLIWQVIMCAFQLVRPLENTSDLFGNWIKSFPKDQRHLVMCGASAVCWVL
jgi:hypothetical protein